MSARGDRTGITAGQWAPLAAWRTVTATGTGPTGGDFASASGRSATNSLRTDRVAEWDGFFSVAPLPDPSRVRLPQPALAYGPTEFDRLVLKTTHCKYTLINICFCYAVFSSLI